MEFSVRHSIPGRVRIHIPAICHKRSLAEAFLGWISGQPGIKTARINYDCASLVLEYDPAHEPMLRMLLDRFRDAEDAVLVATMSFWEGVDVPGRALRLVILDKIPFAVPTDPVVAARSAEVDRQGGNSFAEYSVPSAAITLKQGFGRLLRTQDDRGIVAILDRRIVTKGYGKRLLASLPPARHVSLLEDVAMFWGGVGAT